MGVASLPERVKPAIDWVAMGKRTSRTPRGGWVRRVLTDLLGTWETRLGERRWLNARREDITAGWPELGVGGARSSVEAE